MPEQASAAHTSQHAANGRDEARVEIRSPEDTHEAAPRRDRRGFLGKSGLVLAAAALQLAGSPPASANVATTKTNIAPVGSWQEDVQTPVGLVRAYISFHEDGTLTNTSSGLVAGQFAMCRLGVWKQKGRYTFEYSLIEFTYDASGHWTGYNRPHAHGTMTADGKGYTAQATVGVYDTTDNLLYTFAISGISAKPIEFPPY